MDGIGIDWCSTIITGKALPVFMLIEENSSSLGASSSSSSVSFGSRDSALGALRWFSGSPSPRSGLRASVVAIQPGNECNSSNLESNVILDDLFEPRNEFHLYKNALLALAKRPPGIPCASCRSIAWHCTATLASSQLASSLYHLVTNAGHTKVGNLTVRGWRWTARMPLAAPMLTERSNCCSDHRLLSLLLIKLELQGFNLLPSLVQRRSDLGEPGNEWNAIDA